MRRKTVSEATFDRFKAVLTDFYVVTPFDGEIHEDERQAVMTFALVVTKHWREDVLRELQRIEESMCPVRAFEHRNT